MSKISRDAVLSVVGNIYEGAYDSSAWPAAIESLRVLFNSSQTCLCRVGPDLLPSDTISTSTDPDVYTHYMSDFSHEISPFELAMTSTPVGRIYNDHTLVGLRELRRTRLWNDWMAPQDMYDGIGCKLLSSGPSSWFFDVRRGAMQVEFSAPEIRLLAILSPHIRRAVDIGRNFQTSRVLSSDFSLLPFGILLVDKSLRIIAKNAMAEDLITRPDCALGGKGGFLTVEGDQNTRTLRQLVFNACSISHSVDVGGGMGADFLLTEQQDGATMKFSVSVGPITRTDTRNIFVDPCAVIAVREISFDVHPGVVEQIESVFNLSRKKAELAALLAAGRSLKDAANEQGIKFSTARTYLEEIFDKTATRQQSQLVALLKNIQPIRTF